MSSERARFKWSRARLYYELSNPQWFWIGIILPISILFVAFVGGRSLESNYNVPQGVAAPVIAGVFAILVTVLKLKPDTKQKGEEIAVKRAEVELTHLRSTTSLKCQQIESQKALLYEKKEFVSKLVRFGLELEILKPDKLTEKIEQILDYYKQAHAYDALRIARILDIISKDIKAEKSSSTEIIELLVNLAKTWAWSLDYQICSLNNQVEQLHSSSDQIARLLLSSLSSQQLRSPSENLFRKSLIETDLEQAYLRGANPLDEANLDRVNLIEAYLREANLSKTDLSATNLSQICLSGANLSRVDLTLANLSEANLSGANLSGANLRRADLRRADLRRADLHEANLSEANLSGADLHEANLSGADLHEANLYGISDLPLERIKQAKNWEQAYYDEACRQKLGFPSL